MRTRLSRFLMTYTFAACSALLLSACGDGLLGPNQGRMRVVLSGDASSASANLAGAAHASDVDAKKDDDNGDDDDGDRPSRWFNAANVTLSSILVRNLDGQLVDLDLDLPVIVDVVKIEGGRQILLPDGILPIGAYDQVVIVMTAVQGLTRDGTTITIEPPGGGWTAIVPICPLEVSEGGTATVGISLLVRNSFRWTGNHFTFQPRFRVVDCDDDEG